jgi:hypothetical protein
MGWQDINILSEATMEIFLLETYKFMLKLTTRVMASMNYFVSDISNSMNTIVHYEEDGNLCLRM